MEIIIPENQKEITLGMYQDYKELVKKDKDPVTFLYEKVSIFTKTPLYEVKKIKAVDLEDISQKIDNALNQDAKFEPTFFINDVEFGFLFLDEMLAEEYFDLCTYSKNLEETDKLNRLMAVLFRPIKNKGLNNTYQIEKYEGTNAHASVMRHMPLSVVNGALDFFLRLREELTSYILKSTTEAQQKEKTVQGILKNGVGLPL